MDQTTSPPPATADVAVVQAPSRFRALVRGNEIGLVMVAAVVGILSGLLVIAISGAAQFLHVVLFGLSDGERLSGLTRLASPWLVLVPILGGALLGLYLYFLSRRKTRPMVDPIEANALHGGRMSIRDSMTVVIQNLDLQRLRRLGRARGRLHADFRAASPRASARASRCAAAICGPLVGCGAAAAIAAAFNAPLTGAFYAFELIIGAYTIATLAPVVVAALGGAFVARVLMGEPAVDRHRVAGSAGHADYRAGDPPRHRRRRARHPDHARR